MRHQDDFSIKEMWQVQIIEIGICFCKKVKGDSSSSTRMIVIESALFIYIGNCPFLYLDLNLMKASSRMMLVASRLNIVAKEHS
jgi:hypothetical protein